MEAHIEPFKASPMLEIPKPALGSDEVGDSHSSPPQVEVQAATEAHIEPIKASLMLKIPKLALGPDEASDPPSSPP